MRDEEASSGKDNVDERCLHATEHGSTLLRRFLPRRKFPFPKSLYAVEDALRYYIEDLPDAIVVDFFAGSGTTGHAVMKLNRLDRGTRQSILITNNEVSDEEAGKLRSIDLRPQDGDWEARGICEFITKPRIASAITGRTPKGRPIEGDYRFSDEFPMADGFEENAEFFDLTYEDPETVRLDMAFTAIAPLLWMRAGSQGRRIDEPTDDYDVADTYGVLFAIDAAGPFLKEVAERDELRCAFIVTDDERQFQMIATELPEHVEAVRLYESYLRTFEIGGGE